ncbi:exopolysaccharide biosynthesis WecB/TagA/CpsF family protein [Rhodoferax ferrireducens]|uniref:Exopolysaccharide biosynthesis WecB/TagA/CpsF family protein n=1 Tax=Rhodoferax ferrireducens TaxID=192843 RepID=A0ABU2C6D9_9BURK|nr:WecB/TagA/CpsF family glycosyltransferase [Rhodoferax ferrireducens]MDR7376903.1 exopolysaccharide biosynthesis WecB/TagA/CpsF family protein [Rhodoferax ferrireducens]
MSHHLWQSHWRTLISKISLLQTTEELQHQINVLSSTDHAHVLAFVNAHAMNSVAESVPFFNALTTADTLYRDGIGMALMYKMLSTPAGLNLNGTDLIPRLIIQFNGRPIALYGTQEPYIGKAAHAITATLAPQSHLSLANGFLQATDYVALALEQRPALIILGMGMPKQEQVAAQLRQQLGFACLIVCGGAIIDFLGGKVARAPQWMRQCGLEWIYRLALEPKRLFKRYVQGNPVFIGRSISYKLQNQE